MIIRKAAIRAFAVLLLALVLSPALARDDGRYANDPNKDWINSLTDEIGNVCCSAADGRVVDGPDWGGNPDGTYWVMVDGQKLDVPPTALVIQRNRLHRALVWPFVNGNGELRVRCFLPGAGT